MSGLLIDGAIVPVPGVTVVGPHDAAWAHLSPGDGRPRTGRPQAIMLHKTIADDPEYMIAGKGPPGAARRTTEVWQSDQLHSGAHLVTGHDGEVACLADLVKWEAYHATVSNGRSIGIETCEIRGGGVYQAALQSTVAVVLAACEALGIQLQIDKAKYTGHPIGRMLDGGSTIIGVVGHRSNTERRGKWDPGELLFQMLADRGAEQFDFAKGEDLSVWKGRQKFLNTRGYKLVLDGIPGPATTAALKSEGYRGGIYALGRCAHLP